MTTTLRDLRAAVRSLADPVRAAGVARFFKTGKGEYGEGDKFLGLYVPQLKALAHNARELSHEDTLKLLASPWHEERVLALMLLVNAHERAGVRDKAKIHRAYLANTAHVNNWDLVDLSARELVGYHVARNGTRLVERLARSSSLWERRIAMIATSRCCVPFSPPTPRGCRAPRCATPSNGCSRTSESGCWPASEPGSTRPASHARSHPGRWRNESAELRVVREANCFNHYFIDLL